MLLLTVFITVPSVFATWYYAVNLPQRQEVDVSVTLEPFVYPPEQVLPQDPLHDENHLAAINSILYSSKGGLNSNGNKKTLLPQNLRSYDNVLFSRQNIQGGNLKNIFDTETSENIYFVIHRFSDNEIMVYTMSKPLVDEAEVGDVIVVFRTILTNTEGTWVATQSNVGHSHLREIVVTGMTILSFDPRIDEWHMGEELYM
ncbi:MAG: hypothetical protein IKU67_05335 [Firmicutes bacterium]|nr:hypothetical protein [Bacillota bacterium]